MILTIEKRVELSDTDFICTDEKGEKHRVDLVTDGSLEFKDILDAYEGKRVNVDRLTPYIQIAHEIELVG